ncbi:MAG: hypothetical protein BRD49_06210 [Bacteroidetes bacterium SW_10_40_5]|nr:MAG: hypothetical protein BRD49_06210 [Bacteroidetes bacterium SW_10_40_5]
MQKLYGFLSLMILISLQACEEDISVDLPESEQNLVVEGYVENGAPPYVLLNQDASYFSETSLQKLQTLYVDSADVTISTQDDTLELQRYNSKDFNASQQKGLANILQVKPEDITGADGIGVTFYTIPINDSVINNPITTGKLNQDYSLQVKTDQYEATASTRTPKQAKLDSLIFEPHPEIDSLVQVFIFVDDRAGEQNFYRYFTKRNDEPFYAPNLGSVASDDPVQGAKFKFPINRAQPASADFDEETFGYFTRGDRVVVKFCALPKAHYDFWGTLEEDLRNQGNPFGSPTQARSNVNGALGVWGGYGCDYDTLKIPQ